MHLPDLEAQISESEDLYKDDRLTYWSHESTEVQRIVMQPLTVDPERVERRDISG